MGLLDKSKMRRTCAIIVLGVLMLCWLGRLHGAIDAGLERRIIVGGKIFTHLLSGDERLLQQARKAGTFHVWLVYKSQPEMAEKASSILSAKPANAAPGMAISTLTLDALGNKEPSDTVEYSGIFIAEPLSPDELQQIIQFANTNHVLLFSPFEGDVEAGAATGFIVEVKVQPFLNRKALQQAGINLRPLYLKVSKLHD
ncbi:MAG: hypothetical protein SFY80_10070 [Verrucomicrobiota bacterium]|nr:hypothetical protein [Verrucomicrobiota bacterium]